MWFNVALVLEETARRQPNRTAVIFGDTKLSYAELNAAANQMANVLCSLGIRRGDKVGLMLPNRPEFVIAFHGILKMGGVVVPLHVLLKAEEIRRIVQDSDAVALLAWQSCAGDAEQALTHVPTCGHLIRVGPDDGEDITMGMQPLTAMLSAASRSFETVRTSGDDTSAIVYTSGSTGQPKGAELTHFSIFVGIVDRVKTEPDLGRDGIWLGVLPLAFMAALPRVLTLACTGGAICLLERFDPVTVLAAIQRERVTSVTAVPHMYAAMIAEARRQSYDLSSLSSCVVGGAAPPPGLAEMIEQVLGVVPRLTYASTETGAVATTPKGERLPHGCVGRPRWGVDVRIADEHDNPLPVGAMGEILVRSPMAMKGYYKRPQETAEVMRNGWVHTGDIGYLDEDGYLYVVDRKKNMINRGGAKVYPAEVEAVLANHPAVAEAAVVGVPDPVRGEEVKAFVVLRPGMTATREDIMAFCKERMASYKVPRLLEFCAELPRTPHGKLARSELR